MLKDRVLPERFSWGPASHHLPHRWAESQVPQEPESRTHAKLLAGSAMLPAAGPGPSDSWTPQGTQNPAGSPVFRRSQPRLPTPQPPPAPPVAVKRRCAAPGCPPGRGAVSPLRPPPLRRVRLRNGSPGTPKASCRNSAPVEAAAERACGSPRGLPAGGRVKMQTPVHYRDARWWQSLYFRPLEVPSNSIRDPTIGCGNWRHPAKFAPGEVGGNAGPYCPFTSGCDTSGKSCGSPPGRPVGKAGCSLRPRVGWGRRVAPAKPLFFVEWTVRERPTAKISRRVKPLTNTTR